MEKLILLAYPDNFLCYKKFEHNITSIRGKILGCHFKLCNCHGDIIANYVNSLMMDYDKHI